MTTNFRELYVSNKREEALSADQKERAELLRRQHQLDDDITEDRATVRVQVSHSTMMVKITFISTG